MPRDIAIDARVCRCPCAVPFRVRKPEYPKGIAGGTWIERIRKGRLPQKRKTALFFYPDRVRARGCGAYSSGAKGSSTSLR